MPSADVFFKRAVLGGSAYERRCRVGISDAVTATIASPANLSVEVFTVPSWAEHLRQAGRETTADHLLAEKVVALHRGVEPPIQRALVSHHHTPRRHKLGRSGEADR